MQGTNLRLEPGLAVLRSLACREFTFELQVKESSINNAICRPPVEWAFSP